jgi:hypothetical protein
MFNGKTILEWFCLMTDPQEKLTSVPLPIYLLIIPFYNTVSMLKLSRFYTKERTIICLSFTSSKRQLEFKMQNISYINV